MKVSKIFHFPVCLWNETRLWSPRLSSGKRKLIFQSAQWSMILLVPWNQLPLVTDAGIKAELGDRNSSFHGPLILKGNLSPPATFQNLLKLNLFVSRSLDIQSSVCWCFLSMPWLKHRAGGGDRVQCTKPILGAALESATVLLAGKFSPIWSWANSTNLFDQCAKGLESSALKKKKIYIFF